MNKKTIFLIINMLKSPYFRWSIKLIYSEAIICKFRNFSEKISTNYPNFFLLSFNLSTKSLMDCPLGDVAAGFLLTSSCQA